MSEDVPGERASRKRGDKSRKDSAHLGPDDRSSKKKPHRSKSRPKADSVKTPADIPVPKSEARDPSRGRELLVPATMADSQERSRSGRSDRGNRDGRGGRGGRGDRGSRGTSRGGRGDNEGSSSYRGGRGDNEIYSSYRGGRGSSEGPSSYRGGRGSSEGSSSYRGGFDGFRGSSRGDSRGGRGGRGDRGDRGGRGGRGGGRGGRDGDNQHRPISIPGVNPIPDEAITALEDEILLQQTTGINRLASQMEKLDVKSKKQGRGGPAIVKADSNTSIFPVRSAFGSRGRPIVVWANYFKVNISDMALFKYALTVEPITEDSAVKNPKGNATGKENTKRDVRGRQLHLVIAELIKGLKRTAPNAIVATEFKSTLVSTQILPGVVTEVVLERTSEDRSPDRFKVTFSNPFQIGTDALKQYLASMAVAPEDKTFPRHPEMMDTLNIILGYKSRSKLDEISVLGNSRFFPFGSDAMLCEFYKATRPLLAARGFFQSNRIGTGRLLLNTNVTHGVFKVSGKLDTLFRNLGIRPTRTGDTGESRRLRTFAKFLPKTRAKIKCQTAQGKEFYMNKVISGLACVSELRRKIARTENPIQFTQGMEYCGPQDVRFWLDNTDDGQGGGYITVYDYFQQKYDIQLGAYPLIYFGRADKPTFFPAEFVEVLPGQSVKVKLNASETTDMVNFACRSPEKNAMLLLNDSHSVLSHDDEQLNKFGISVDKSLLAVHARVLGTPEILYAKGKGRNVAAPTSGSWNMVAQRVAKPGNPFERWSWLSIMDSRRGRPVDSSAPEQFAEFLSDKMGVRIAKAPVTLPFQPVTLEDARSGSALKAIFEWLKKERIQLLLIILPAKDSTGVYNCIKTLGDCVYGIHTSCVVAQQFLKCNPGNFANVGLKINLKAGSVNHVLKENFGLLKDGKTMIVGYDVTHPTNMSNNNNNNTGKKDTKQPPSLVGLVASIDQDFGQWPAISWEQESRQEMLSDELVSALGSRLDLWKKYNNGKLPENIIIFRDGVSESQYSQVISDELPSLREACAKRYSGKQPSMSIIVSVKRHHTRFYPSSADSMSSSGNIPNGTVVDRGVTQVRYWDFYLTAHHALKGTARPAHYTVLLDEVFEPRYKHEATNELERLTHELCYLFGRATKAVSICPPAYYADIVCERARVHRPEYDDFSETESTISSSLSMDAKTRDIHPDLRNSMYYI